MHSRELGGCHRNGCFVEQFDGRSGDSGFRGEVDGCVEVAAVEFAIAINELEPYSNIAECPLQRVQERHEPHLCISGIDGDQERGRVGCDVVETLFDDIECLTHGCEQCDAGAVQFHAIRAAIEQRLTEGPFERRDLPGHAGLRQAECGRSRSERPLARRTLEDGERLEARDPVEYGMHFSSMTHAHAESEQKTGVQRR